MPGGNLHSGRSAVAASAAAPAPAVLPLHHEHAVRMAHKKLATFDIETRARKTGADAGALYGEVCPYGVCLYGDASGGDQPTPQFCADLDTFLTLVLSDYAGFTLAAHNGSGYEFLYLLDPLRRLISRDARYTLETIHQGERVIGYTLSRTEETAITRGERKGEMRQRVTRWYFLDTLPLFHVALSEVARCYCPHLPKLAHDHTRVAWDYHNPAHRRYLVRDCEIVYVAYRALERLLFEQFAAHPGRTAGATALHAFTASIPPGHVYYRHHPEVEQFIRRAYRGALVVPGTTTRPQANIALVDMTAAYGYQMLTHRYPVGAPCHTHTWQRAYVGVYACYVTTPDPDVLPFGIIAEETTGYYPLGAFRTVCTSVEMEYAETLGYSFEIIEGYYWARTESVFQPLMARCERLERDARYKPLAKLLRNSLYGKFGARARNQHFIVAHEEERAPLGAIVVLDPVSGDEIPGLYAIEETVDQPYMMPTWAALITAYQRVYLAQRILALYALGAPSVYADTDSLAARMESIEQLRAEGWLEPPEPDALYGSWKTEQIAPQFMVTAPKVYAIFDTHGKLLDAKAKGLPLQRIAQTEALSRATFASQEATRAHSYTFTSAHTLRDRLEHPALPIQLTRRRAISVMARSPGWRYDPATGAIRPIVALRARPQSSPQAPEVKRRPQVKHDAYRAIAT